MSRLLITHLDTSLHGNIPSSLESQLILPAQKAYTFIDQWMRDREDVAAWKKLSEQIGAELDIFPKLESLPPESLQDAATFEDIDKVIIRQCVIELKARAGDLKRWHTLIQKHSANLIVRDADDENELVREFSTISVSIISDFGDF